MKRIILEYLNYFKNKREHRVASYLSFDDKLVGDTISYTTNRKLLIFFMSPFILIGEYDIGKSVFQLKKEGYSLLFKQRLRLLIGGVIFWIVLFNLFYFTRIGEDSIELEGDDLIEYLNWKDEYESGN
ncbi:hypothetical protein [Aureibacter tunicatorum]|uniref:Uncharacterized protein n=1 Tax=Aureibacter tunicatorum TaxID=866807 RepID=A0AAE3XNA1_9BACT|nr:hypothetical protein [Aureibacter tunicatorum]MDR6240092.1 hypothetical protein [Aureibacter tunicatorum]BDD04563.1 hypothetical protein AUTU_20460 [Aureibacter tunicatorum]